MQASKKSERFESFGIHEFLRVNRQVKGDFVRKSELKLYEDLLSVNDSKNHLKQQWMKYSHEKTEKNRTTCSHDTTKGYEIL